MRQEVIDLINEIQKEFPNEVVNEENLNEFFILLENKKNCANCKGLNECKNSNLGFYLTKTEEGFKQAQCEYLKYKNSDNYKSDFQSELKLELFDSDIKKYDLDSENRQKILNEIKKFVNEFGKKFNKGLYIYGSFSTGKTYSLSILAKELKKRNIEYLFVYFPDLVIELKESTGTEKYYKKIDLLKKVDVLIIDDFGAENISQWFRDEILGPIINTRILFKRPMFMSSNISPKFLTQHLMLKNTSDEESICGRIVSRLNDLVKSISLETEKKYRKY